MPSSTFSRLFGQSPIRPIQDHIARAHECAEKLLPFLDAAIANDWGSAAAVRLQIGALEDAADEIKKDLRLNLPKSLLMPINRNDLLDLITRQDQIANCAKDISGLMLGRNMTVPGEIAAQLKLFAETAVATSAQAMKIINELDELLEMGFRGNAIEQIEGMIEELDRLEHENDKIQVTLRAELFAIEKDLPPVDVMFLYKIIDRIGDLADFAQKVGSRMLLLLAR